jgi:hypothetical protein
MRSAGHITFSDRNGLFGHSDSGFILASVTGEKAEFDGGRILREKSEIHP